MHRNSGFFVRPIIVLGDLKANNGEYLAAQTMMFDGKTIILNEGIVDPTRVDRIVQQIKSIGDYGQENHDVRYLTPLVTNEFGFFPRSSPLSLDEYKTIIRKTAEALKDLPPNIVIVASSMPVLWSDDTLRNAILHIQSPNQKGSRPIIHYFSKEYFSRVDPHYARSTSSLYDNGYFEFKPDDYSSEHSPDIVLQGTGVSCYSENQYKSAIVVYGLNLPPIINTTDTCIEHFKQVAKRNVQGLLQKLKKDIPIHVNHIITSHTSYSMEKLLLAAPIHADVVHKKVGHHLLEEKTEIRTAYFGTLSNFFVYPPMRAEILKRKLLNLALYKISKTSDRSLAYLCDNEENTLLHQVFLPSSTYLTEFFHLKVFGKIINYFFDDTINQTNIDGDTPLHLALKITDESHIHLTLFQHGARLDIRNHQNQSPITWAYQNNKSDLIEKLINELINESNLYLANKKYILNIIQDIPDLKLKRKIAASALCFAMSHLDPEGIDEKEAIKLLLILENGKNKLFIKHNIGQLLNTFRKGILYYHLVDHNALEENKNLVATLPEPLRDHLLQLNLLRKSYSPSLFKNGIIQLICHLDQFEKQKIHFLLNSVMATNPDENLHQDFIEETLIPKLIENEQLSQLILKRLPSIENKNLEKRIVRKFIQQYIYLKILERGLVYESDIIKFSWKNLSNINFYFYDPYTQTYLTILEQFLLHVLRLQDAMLLKSVFSNTYQGIGLKTIISSTEKAKIDNPIIAQQWFLQTQLENMIKQNNQCESRWVDLFFILHFYPYLDLEKSIIPGTTILENLLFFAYNWNNPTLLDKITKIISTDQLNNINFMIENAIRSESSPEHARKWLCQTLLENEIKHVRYENLDLIKSIFNQSIDCEKLSNYYNLTIGEYLIYLACTESDLLLLEKIRILLPKLCSSSTIDKVFNTLSYRKEAIQAWLWKQLLSIELKQNHVNLDTLSWLVLSCDLYALHQGATIGEALITQAFIQKNESFLNLIGLRFQWLFDAKIIHKISTQLSDGLEFKEWISTTLLHNELKRKSQADKNKLYLILSTLPSVNLLDKPSHVGQLKLGELLLCHSYYTNDPRLFSEVFALFPIASFEELCTALSLVFSFPPEGIAWFNEQLAQVSAKHNQFAGLTSLQQNTSITLFSTPPERNEGVHQHLVAHEAQVTETSSLKCTTNNRT